MQVKMVLPILTQREAEIQWDACMALLKNDMSWVLANLEKLETFKVPWNNYSRFKKPCSECLTYNKKTANYCKKCGNDIKMAKYLTFGVGKTKHL